MARQVDGGQEELINTAYALSDALRQLKAASAKGQGRDEFERDGGERQEDLRKGRGRYEKPGGIRSDWHGGRGGERNRRGGWRGRECRVTPGTSWRYSRMHEPCDSSVEGHGEQQYFSKKFKIPEDRNHSWRDRSKYCPENMRSPRESQKAHWKHRVNRGQEHSVNREQGHWVSREQGDHRVYNQDSKEQIMPFMLVKALAVQPAFSVSLLQLLEDYQMSPAAVRSIVSQHSHIFSLQGEEVNLQPQLDICAAYCEPKGCQDRSSCTNLHICPNVALGKCDSGPDCVFGHRWHTDHNLSILQPLFLDQLHDKSLCELLQQMYNIDHQKQELLPLSVCDAYNKGSCSQTECSDLHVCVSFVTGSSWCSRDNCKLNHNILSSSCHHLLQQHGISTNESPRDIVAALLHANPELSKCNQPQEDQKNTSHTEKDPPQPEENPPNSERNVSKSESKVPKLPEKSSLKSDSVNRIKLFEDGDSDTSSASDTSSTTESADSVSGAVQSGTKKQSRLKADYSSFSSQRVIIKKESRFKKSEVDCSTSSGSEYMSTDDSQSTTESLEGNVKKGTKVKVNKIEKGRQPSTVQRRTLWAHYLQGDVATPEICYHSVEDVCELEGSGCPRLHASHHFHWQVRRKSSIWMNLRHSQVTCLERAFCDPEQDGVDLPRLDPALLDMSVSGLLILLGRDIWHAHFSDTASFTAFTLTNSSKTLTLELRRLCTEVLPGKSTAPMLNAWYFLDKNNKWVKYGKVDTVGETNLISSATSDDVEKHYLQSPTVPLSFKNSQFSYNLDFQTMKQSNLKTNVQRTVRRRPEPHLPVEEDGKGSVQASSPDLPSHWEVMQAEERLRMVTLAPTSEEYQKTVNLFAGRVSSSNVIKVERIQNPFLWRPFQNKIKELTAKYKDSSKVDVRQLFHGTAHNVVASICAENLDWRLHGSASGQTYGRGTYFSNDAAYSYNYCKADSNGMKHMFVVRVAVGLFTAGNSSMVRPPPNPATSDLYDSTVNSEANPSIIVKYDKQEYYPEYVVTLI